MSPRALLALLLLAAPAAAQGPSPAPAARGMSAGEQLRKVQERRAALEQELGRLRGQEKGLLGEVERLELEERLRREQLQETRLLLARTNAALDRTQRQARELEQKLDATRPQLASRARALYKLGELSYVRLLLSVDRPQDLFRGYRFVAALARRDNQRLSAFRADLAALSATRAALEQRTREALALRAGLERARAALQADRRRKTELLTQIVEKKEIRAAYLQELQQAEEKLNLLVQGFAEGEVSVPVAAFRGSLLWPLGGRVRSGFGLHKHPRFETYTVQNGIEIEAAEGTPVAAVHEGTVVFAERFQGYGLMVVLDHGAKHHSLYAHLGELAVRPGQKVPAGETLGTAGVGLSGPGVYFEMRFQSKPEDPLEWLRRPETERREADR